MNLIMSDVEETIMIVDGLEEQINAAPAVRVCHLTVILDVVLSHTTRSPSGGWRCYLFVAMA
jgi:hypothetical protein